MFDRWQPKITEVILSAGGQNTAARMLFCGPTKILFNQGSYNYTQWLDYSDPDAAYSAGQFQDNLQVFSAPDSSASGMVYYGSVGQSTSPGNMTVYTKTINPITEEFSSTSVTLSNVKTASTSKAIMLGSTPVWSASWVHITTPRYSGSVLYSGNTLLLDHSTGGGVYQVHNKLTATMGQYKINTGISGASYPERDAYIVTESSAATATTIRVDLVYGDGYYLKGTGEAGDFGYNEIVKYDTSFNRLWSIAITNKSGEEVFVHLLGAYNGYLYAVSVPATNTDTDQVCTLHQINPSDGLIINSYDFANSTVGFKNKNSYTWNESCAKIRSNYVTPIVSYNGYFAMIVTKGNPWEIIVIKVP